MRVRINGDSVEIEGYVNAIERKSKPLMSRIGQFVERICKGAFNRAIKRNNDIRLLLNHDWGRDLGGTGDGSLELTEDAIGLKARATVTDAEVIEKARNGELVGWSFGFTDVDVDTHDENGMTTRDVKDLDLYEVSILDRSKSPAYDGTLVAVRSDDTTIYHGETMDDEAESVEITGVIETIEERAEETESTEQEKEIDYSEYEEMIREMKGE